MQGLKLRLNKALEWVKSRKIDWGGIFNVLTILAFTIGIIALLTLIWLYVRPIQTANIKVPVATDQSSYHPGEEISGIFFGDTYFNGEVRVLREVFCKDYKGVIAPPEGARDGDFFTTQGRPRHLEGQSVSVGNLPSNIPVGLNCVLQFTNVYEVQTPFGIRRLEYQYYTQNFAIVTKERRLQLECEAAGRKDCNFIIDVPAANNSSEPTPLSAQSSPETAPTIVQPQPQTTTNNTTNNTTINPPAEQEPAPRFVEQCTVDLLGIKAFCRQVPVKSLEQLQCTLGEFRHFHRGKRQIQQDMQ